MRVFYPMIDNNKKSLNVNRLFIFLFNINKKLLLTIVSKQIKSFFFHMHAAHGFYFICKNRILFLYIRE
jgi:hypothetical protein